MVLKLYNTLTKKTDEFKPLHPPYVGMYSCGPTVYDYQHIGHMRRYVGDDILIRVLKHSGYEVKHVMNITDVGHLTSDADVGEDKMEKGALKFGLSVWDLAKKFEQQFLESAKALNIQKPNVLMHATDYIDDQIALVHMLEKKGFTYVIKDDGVYFDTSKFPEYGMLAGQKPEALKKGARVDFVKGKRNVTDFALWKFSPASFDSAQDGSAKRRQMEWESPWGVGFPGWHIECSAMSMKELGFTFDIHTGGIDHIPIHHTNEIAQSEAATGQPFVRYWVHHNFLHVEGQKMSKSLGNIFTVQDVSKKGFDPMALRYLYLQTHYRQEMNFTWEALAGAQKALQRLREEFLSYINAKAKPGCAQFEQEFLEAINDDLNMPQALAVVWELLKSDYPPGAKFQSLRVFDNVLGLELQYQKSNMNNQKEKIPDSIMNLVQDREALRKQKRFHLADKLRHKIRKLGYDVLDTQSGTTVKKISTD
ncbi:MAG: cysteine--tRNA ligase [Candidatus Levybacteria bacterium]|nr:cysteine--tRNA ligase [Candidatus Levybacteria bacterium]